MEEGGLLWLLCGPVAGNATIGSKARALRKSLAFIQAVRPAGYRDIFFVSVPPRHYTIPRAAEQKNGFLPQNRWTGLTGSAGAITPGYAGELLWYPLITHWFPPCPPGHAGKMIFVGF